jgi:hypothetical protein
MRGRRNRVNCGMLLEEVEAAKGERDKWKRKGVICEEV